MDLQKLLRVGICVAGLGITVSACTQTSTETATSTVTTTSTAEVAVEQAVWQKLTSDGDAAKAAGDLKKAEMSYQAAVEEAKKLGESDPAFSKTTANLADFYYAQGDGQQADKLYKQSLALREKAVGLEHADLIQSILGLARVTSAEKNYGESVAHYERVLAIMKKTNTPVPAEVETEYEKAKENASQTKGSSKEESTDAAKDGAKGAAKDAEKGAAKDAEKGAAKDAEKGAAKDAEKGATKDAEKGAAKDAEKGAAKDAEKKASK
ncbi:MAG TPA: tetratricopeptide repeat protein [Drouetiella sp.]